MSEEKKEYKLALPLATRLYRKTGLNQNKDNWLVVILNSDGIPIVTEELEGKSFACLALRTYKAIVEAVNNSARYREALEKIKNMECMPESIEDFYIDSFYKNCNRFLRIPQDIARIALEGGNE